MLSHLIDNGADIHASATGIGTPFHVATSKASASLVRYLVDAGADVDAFDDNMGTPLHCGASCGSADIALCLLEGGAGAGINTFSVWRGTPLGVAVDRTRIDVVEVLLEQGVDVNAPCTHQGRTALMMAAMKVARTDNESQIRCMQLLCEHGAAVDLQDQEGWTALMIAEHWGSPEGIKDLRRILRSYNREHPLAVHVQTPYWSLSGRADSTEFEARTRDPAGPPPSPVSWARQLGKRSS